MTTEQFFSTIMTICDWDKSDDNEIVKPLVDFLSQQPDEEIFSFDDIMSELLYTLDTKKNYKRACRVCSHSIYTFLYSRCAALINGVDFFESVKKGNNDKIWNKEFECILYVPITAWSHKHNEDADKYPHISSYSYETGSNFDGWKPFFSLSRGLKKGTIPENISELPFEQKIEILVGLARKSDSGYKVFGSKRHKYRFNPVVDISSVKSLEQRIGMTLPKEYSDFFTKVGNGGAGIDYGLYPIEIVEREFLDHEGLFASEGMTLFDYDEPSKIYLQRIVDANKLYENDDEVSIQKADALYSDIIRGMLIIGTAGCSSDYFIMCSGSKKGYVGILNWDMMPEKNWTPVLFNMTFTEWLENYFKKIILGKVQWHNDFCTVKCEKRL